MENLLLIVFIIFAALQVLLLIKIWNMTDNVKSIKNSYMTNNLYNKAKTAYILGDLNKAKSLLDESFAYDIVIARSGTSYDGIYSTEFSNIVKKYSRIYKAMNLEILDLSAFEEFKSLPD